MNNFIDSITLAKYIIYKMQEKGQKINHLKLQKLLYYVQAWHLVYTDEPLIKEEFEAWLHGPVNRNVWNYYKGYSIMFDNLPYEDNEDLEKICLTEDQQQIIDDVLDEYGTRSGYYLECLTHAEEPWKKAREEGENAIISKESMKEYYSKMLDVS